jgi:SNF2 family DNA or RNA helicase
MTDNDTQQRLSHRLGQAYPVNVYAYTCEQTVEERIEVVLRRKRGLPGSPPDRG